MQFFAAGEAPVGVIAIGQFATGVVAIGQGARGVVAIGQLASGVIVVGQVAVGLVAFGQLALGGVWAGGMLALAPTSGTSLLGLGPIGELSLGDLVRLRLTRFRNRHPNWWGLAFGAVFAVTAGAIVWATALAPLLDELTTPEPPRELR